MSIFEWEYWATKAVMFVFFALGDTAFSLPIDGHFLLPAARCESIHFPHIKPLMFILKR